MLRTIEYELLAKVARKRNWGKWVVKRRSDEQYDIEVEGETWENGFLNMAFSAWLPLAAIRAVDWTKPEIWGLTNAYCDIVGFIPAQGHDWSGVRDSSNDAIWEMFDVALVLHLGEEGGA